MAAIALVGVALAAIGISVDLTGLAIGGALTVFVAMTWFGLGL